MIAYQRNSRWVRSFRPSEDECAEWCRRHDWSASDIGDYLGRAKSSVQNRLVILARRAEEDES